MWVGLDEYNHDDICTICQEQYGKNKAIYKTPCNHFFHNNCLNDYCETTIHGQIVCPVCRKKIEHACMDVWAFKEKAMDTDTFKNHHVNSIYLNQNENGEYVVTSIKSKSVSPSKPKSVSPSKSKSVSPSKPKSKSPKSKPKTRRTKSKSNINNLNKTMRKK